MRDKEYIERGALLKTPPFTKYGGDLTSEYTVGYLDCAEYARMAVKCAPADDVVEVVRCKDCKYFKHFKGCGNWCHRRIRTDIEFHTKTNDFCSWGKRKDKDDGR